jgi:chromosome segregation ATPase
MTDEPANGLQRTLGKIEGMLSSAQTSREITRKEIVSITKNIDAIKGQHSETMSAVKELAKDHEYLKARVDGHAAIIDSHEKMKQRGVGIMTGVGLAGGSVGALIAKYLPFWTR